MHIPKAGSKKRRPLGVPALEDKLVQAGLAKILQAIYEQDFINDSYGSGQSAVVMMRYVH